MTGCPFAPGRRGLLTGGLGLAAGAMSATLVPRADAAEPVPATDPTMQRQPFYGLHQAGIVTPRQGVALLAAFDVVAASRGDLARMLRGLTDRLATLTQGGAVPTAPARMPPPDSGLLGTEIFPDNLTATFAVGASLFDERYGLADRRPRQLVAMARFPNDALDAELCHGDLLLQFCANTRETVIHALRAVLKDFPDTLALRWKVEGFLPPRSVAGPGGETSRNLLGFKDGTANPDSGDRALMDRLVWVSPPKEEPDWTTGGSYQVVRLIRTLVERWDRTPLDEQQGIIGRDKATGAPLGGTQETEAPRYADDPAGARIRLDAHIRLANPRTPGTERHLILRRPYNYSLGLTKAGQLDMGLLFVCFQNDLRAGFLAVQERLNGEPLEEYVKPVGGGYFFALPGVPGAGRFLGDRMLGPDV